MVTSTMSPIGFLSRDPIGYGKRDRNLYQYTQSRPLIGMDPRGNDLVIAPGPEHNPGGNGTVIGGGGGFPTLPLPPVVWPDIPSPPQPPSPPGSDWPRNCADCACTFILLDARMPDGSDGCPPKWVCYAVVGCVAATIYCTRPYDHSDDEEDGYVPTNRDKTQKDNMGGEDPDPLRGKGPKDPEEYEKARRAIEEAKRKSGRGGKDNIDPNDPDL